MINKVKQFNCGHLRNRENTYTDIRGWKRCAECQKAYEKGRYYRTSIYLDHIRIFTYLMGLPSCLQ